MTSTWIVPAGVVTGCCFPRCPLRARGWPVRLLRPYLAGPSAGLGPRPPAEARLKAVASSCQELAARKPAPAEDLPQADWLQRTRLLVKAEGAERLRNARVLLVGLGGVGSFAAEFLARAGVGHMTIVDGDVVDVTNKNRQLPALDSTIGRRKADVIAKRLRDINPEMGLRVCDVFLEPGPSDAPNSIHGLFQDAHYDYVVDCIDTLAPKVELLMRAREAGCTVVSSMGAGGKLDPGAVRVADLMDTLGDSLAKAVRKRVRQAMRQEGHEGHAPLARSGVVAVFSDEPARPASVCEAQSRYKRSYYGTISYMPAVFGLAAAAYVIRHCLGEPQKLYTPERATPTRAGGKRAVSNGAREGKGAKDDDVLSVRDGTNGVGTSWLARSLANVEGRGVGYDGSGI